MLWTVVGSQLFLFYVVVLGPESQFDKVTRKGELISHSSCAKKLNCCLTIHSSTMPTTSPGGRAWARNTIWTEPYQR